MGGADEWTSDDPTLGDDEVIYRRVSKKDQGSFTVDRKSGERRLGPGAFSLNGNDYLDPAGCSVHLERLLISNEIPTNQLVNWETHGVGRFKAIDVRNGGGGVVLAPDDADEVLGKAHALLRTKSVGLPRGEWRDVRAAILDKAIYFESDPGYFVASDDA